MNKILFYPCCGQDIERTVAAWDFMIDEFWFAEINFTFRHKSKNSINDSNVIFNRPALSAPHMKILTKTRTMYRSTSGQIVPVRSDTYTNTKLQKPITLHFAGGCAVEAFDVLPSEKLSVFVHLRDARISGEGSSGICWLDDIGSGPYPNGMLKRVLNKLTVGSYIVTDGSNAIPSLMPYKDLFASITSDKNSIRTVTAHGFCLQYTEIPYPDGNTEPAWQVIGHNHLNALPE